MAINPADWPTGLTSTEARLLEAFRQGEILDLRAGAATENDPGNADSWPTARQVRAEVISAILLGATSELPGFAPALRLVGADIVGTLNIWQAEIRYPLSLAYCRMSGGIELNECTLQSVNLSYSHLKNFEAQIATVNGQIALNYARTGYINLLSSTIQGWVSLNGCELTPSNEAALTADGVIARGGIFARDGFSAKGELRLIGAQLDGPLILEDATCKNPGGVAINADGLTVRGDMSLKGLHAEGEVRLPGSTITGQLRLDGAHLLNPGAPALSADASTIGESAFFIAAFQCEGEINLHGAKVTGLLTFNTAQLKNPHGVALTARELTLNGDLVFSSNFQALGSVDLSDGNIAGHVDLHRASLIAPDGIALFARGITVSGTADCQGLRAKGKVSFEGASIAGQLLLTGAQLSSPGPDGVALQADRISVDGGIYGQAPLRVEGEVRLPGSRVGAQVVFNGAEFINPDGDALVADKAAVLGDFLCREGFTAYGAVRLVAAHIGLQLNFDGANIICDGRVGFCGDGLVVDRGMFCQEGFTVFGEVRLIGAHISGQLAFNDARFINTQCPALTCDQLVVEGAMYCGFYAEGAVSLVSARISGQLGFVSTVLLNATGTALNCQGLQADSLYFLVIRPVSGVADFQFCRVRVFGDDPSMWPSRMLFEGFSYGELQPYRSASGKGGRLEWLARGGSSFRAQPYQQLADSYRKLGNEGEARKVLREKERARHKERGLFGWLVGRVLDGVVGYGYRPELAFVWFVALWIFAGVFFTYNHPVPVNTATHPSFSPFVYAASVVTPVISFGQANIWYATGSAQIVVAFLVGIGWVLATAFVAGVTRILTRK